MGKTDIRLNWAEALDAMTKGKTISDKIGWGFTNQDLFILGCFHEIGLWRDEIEDLLEDCNFHTEYSMLINGEYTEYKKEIYVF